MSQLVRLQPPETLKCTGDLKITEGSKLFYEYCKAALALPHLIELFLVVNNLPALWIKHQ